MTNSPAKGALDFSQIARLGTWQNMLPIVVGSLTFVLPGKTPFDLRVMQPSGIGGIAWMNTAAAFAVAGAVSLAGSYSPFLYFQF